MCFVFVSENINKVFFNSPANCPQAIFGCILSLCLETAKMLSIPAYHIHFQFFKGNVMRCFLFQQYNHITVKA